MVIVPITHSCDYDTDATLFTIRLADFGCSAADVQIQHREYNNRMSSNSSGITNSVVVLLKFVNSNNKDHDHLPLTVWQKCGLRIE